MLKIKRLRVEILSDKSLTIDQLFGFDFNFYSGLNIVAGPNSRGKTTINSCIYYALGMEELLGAHNEKALDKALKEEFTTIDNESFEQLTHTVQRSRVLLEIENGTSNIASIIRYIKPDSQEKDTKKVEIFDSRVVNQSSPIILFTSGRGNNEDDNGFYVWLANFIGIEIPVVSNTSRVTNYSPLYLQTIFSTLFIEQTKGWSDFFATMPFYGITKVKEKNVEFLLSLNELRLSIDKDILNKNKNSIIEEWNKTIKSFVLLEKQFNGTFENLPIELTTESSELERINMQFSVSEGEKIVLENYLETKKTALEEFENIPISTVEINREATLVEYQTQREAYQRLKEYIANFELKLGIDNTQFANLKSQLATLDQEIKKHVNLAKVFSENIVNGHGGNYCPTCSQEVSTDLISSKNITIPQLSLEENTNFLRSQKKMVETTLKSLEGTINEKTTLLSYFNNTLRQKEILIKSLSRDLISDDRAFSEAQIVKKLQLEKEIQELEFIKVSISDLKEQLSRLGTQFHNNNIELNVLRTSEVTDEDKLREFESLYKELLYSFGYESNERYHISINRKEPFKYFPVYKRHPNDTTPQSIRINSSASDFVRNIWSYTLTLLQQGINHPGIIMFDEPGQHRTNISSLKALLYSSSVIENRQIIIFTSIGKQLNENEKLELNVLLEGLNEQRYKLIQLDDTHKVIQEL